MKVTNVKTYGIAESLIRSGYPMSTLINESMESAVKQYGITDAMFKRGVKLGNTKGGSGHDCFLKGIIVQMDITAPQYWWQQAQRYHWFEIISSQSKMHKILEMDLNECRGDASWQSIEDIKRRVRLYNDGIGSFESILDNIPMGLEYTAGISTNYLQLKSMYYQRKTHRLSQWKVFCEWCEGLPYFKELCLGGK